jgi:hypothetical protein
LCTRHWKASDAISTPDTVCHRALAQPDWLGAGARPNHRGQCQLARHIVYRSGCADIRNRSSVKSSARRCNTNGANDCANDSANNSSTSYRNQWKCK